MATKWGICAAGSVSFDFVSAIQLLPSDEHRVVAVATRNDLAKAKNFAEKFGIDATFGSYKELAQYTDIDVVYIGTINSLHYEACKLMIEAGKNVLCEKPLCVNAKQVEELIILAKEHNVFLMEALWSRFFPAYQHIWSAIDSNSSIIGKPLNAYIPFCSQNIHKNRIAMKNLGEGVLLDIGCYAIQLALWVFKSKPVSVKAFGQLANNNDIDVFENIILEFSGGRIASLHTSGLVNTDNEAVVVGTRGFFKLPMMHAPSYVISSEGKYDFPLPEPKHPLNFHHGSGMVYEIRAVRECLQKDEKECCSMSHSDSLIIAQIMDEVRKQIGISYDC